MKKAAILIDGGWFTKVLRRELSIPGKPRPTITADLVCKNALQTLASDEEAFRIFYYDAFPFDGTAQNPVDGTITDFSKTGTYSYHTKLCDELGQMDLVALRRGVLKQRGWTLTEPYIQNAITHRNATPPQAPPLLGPGDVYLHLEQKGVDMRIGIDVATLSIKKLVDRIILLSGDTDMIPAMKLCRREGVQVCVTQVGATRVSKELIEDADFLRKFTPIP